MLSRVHPFHKSAAENAPKVTLKTTDERPPLAKSQDRFAILNPVERRHRIGSESKFNLLLRHTAVSRPLKLSLSLRTFATSGGFHLSLILPSKPRLNLIFVSLKGLSVESGMQTTFSTLFLQQRVYTRQSCQPDVFHFRKGLQTSAESPV